MKGVVSMNKKLISILLALCLVIPMPVFAVSVDYYDDYANNYDSTISDTETTIVPYSLMHNWSQQLSRSGRETCPYGDYHSTREIMYVCSRCGARAYRITFSCGKCPTIDTRSDQGYCH